jgi:phospholipid-transporting ATPase
MMVWQAESPDEKALVEAARDFGYILIGRTTSAILVQVAGVQLTYEPLAVNKFDSDRKRMSIILRDSEGALWLFCKGADTSMMDRGSCRSPELKATMMEHLKLFAEEGLRTLVLGYRQLTEREFQDWMVRYKQAATSDNRATEMTKVADSLERDMSIVGLSAIEDKLQDGVPDTIADLARAGIKVCVLTGDKMETAINIGYSCKVLREGMNLLKLNAGTAEEVERCLCLLYQQVLEKFPYHRTLWEKMHGRPEPGRAAVLQRLKKNCPETVELDQSGWMSNPLMGQKTIEPGPGLASDRRPSVGRGGGFASLFKSSFKGWGNAEDLAVIMEGSALVFVLGKPDLETMVFEIMQACSAVIACRVSPKQKAQLVHLVKAHVTPVPVTLAIGDGANDVGMIQEAHVGIGISGNEGQQAVNASDFAVAQFRFLKRLLLVHGRYNYRRMCKVVLYSFYKNLVLVSGLFFFLLYSGFSGTSLFEDNILAGYNFFLGLPILTLGLFDKDISVEYAMATPQMYEVGRNNRDLNTYEVVKWIWLSLLHGVFIYFFTLRASSVCGAMAADSFYIFGLSVYSVLIFTMNLKVLFEFKTITKLQGVWDRLICKPEGKR